MCNLADWIGYNEEWFPFVATPDDGYIGRAREQAEYAIRKVELDIGAQRVAFSAAVVPDFAALFGLGSPNAIRRAAAQDTPPDAPVAIIESETGSGKTAAALQSSRAAVVRQALERYLEDFDDPAVASERMRDAADPALEWDAVRRELLNKD